MRTLKRLLRASRLVLTGITVLASVVAAVIVITISSGLRDAPSVVRMTFMGSAAAGLAILLGIAYRHRMWLQLVRVVVLKLRASLPVWEHQLDVPGLVAPVVIAVDQYGIPTIKARSRNDAMCALGYVTAQDRLFQMDLLRKQAAGRMSEMFGRAALNMDIASRELGLNRVAADIVRLLPNRQREALQSYANGVNAFLATTKCWPFEFLLLNLEPGPWTEEDSILVELWMFQMLCGDDSSERMLTIMEQTLPGEVFRFLTSDDDRHDKVLVGGPESRRPATSIPVAALALLLQQAKSSEVGVEELVTVNRAVAGSNNWALDKSRTKRGTALLANDLHLGPTVPNTWYRVRIGYENVESSGVLLPGVPIVVAGSNGHIAWGVTNAAADCLDLVRLEINPANEAEYLCADGWKPFGRIAETINIKGEEPLIHQVRTTIWGPVSRTPLMGGPVAIHWTALDPTAVDIGFMDMTDATTVEESIGVANQFAGPPMNVVIADERGRIAWTVCGRLPVRQGFDGSTATSWSRCDRGWRGFIPADELPRVIDPPSGILGTANNRTTGTGYVHVIGHHFSNSCRINRVFELLTAMEDATEEDMLAVQLDTAVELYEFYRQLALEVLTTDVIAARPRLRKVRRGIEAWNGKADVRSRGLGVVLTFREALGQAIISPFLSSCRVADQRFTYTWSNIDTPLRRLLTERIPSLLPDPDRHANWEALILAALETSVQRLERAYANTSAGDLMWGRLNRVTAAHPLAVAVAMLRPFLNMRTQSLPGCLHSICVSSPGLTASVRMVVSPGRHETAILQMPCGQAGHPLSRNYDDQQKHWVAGRPFPFLPGDAVDIVTLTPRRPHEQRRV